MMRRSRITPFLILALLWPAPVALAKGSGPGRNPEKAEVKAQRALEKGEAKAERTLQKADTKGERALEKAEAKELRDRPSDVGQGTSEGRQEGFMGRMRRFFGWERSQERMSDQGRAHERATEQERGPGDRSEPEGD